MPRCTGGKVRNAGVLKALVAARAKRHRQKPTTFENQYALDPYVRAAMRSSVVADHAKCRVILRLARQACLLLYRALASEGFTEFFGMQRHLLCVMLKCKFGAYFGRASLALVMTEFGDELAKHGFVEEPEFWNDSDHHHHLNRKYDPTCLCSRVTLAQTRRQYGKSMVMQFAAAVYMTIFDRETVLLTSHRQKLNDQNRAEVVRLLKVFGQETPVINSGVVTLANGNQLIVRAQGGLRGIRPTSMMIDEAAFVEESTFSRMIMPIMINPNRVTHAFTTPNGDNFTWSHLLSCTEEYRVVIIRDVCERCRDQGRNTCLCMAHHAPDVFRSAEVQGLMNAFYGSDPQAYAEEVLGITVSSDATALPAAWIDRMIGRPWPFPHKLDPDRKRLYLSYDPTGSNISGTAFVVAAQDRDSRTVALVHIDYEIFKTDTIDIGVGKLVADMVAHLAKRFPGHQLITALECNNNLSHTTNVAGMIDGACRLHRMQCLHTTRKMPGGTSTPGLLVDPKTKMDGYLWLRGMMDRGELLLDPDLRTSAKSVRSTRESEASMVQAHLDSLKRQLQALKLVMGPRHVQISGKHDGSNDDLAITMINLMWLMRSSSFSVPDVAVPRNMRAMLARG